MDKNVLLLPKGWEQKNLGELGKIITGSTPSKAIDDYWRGGKHPFVKPPDLDMSTVFTSSEKLTDLGLKKTRLVPQTSVLVCCIGSIGKIGIAGLDVATNQQINSILFDTEKVNFRFGFYYLLSSKDLLIELSNNAIVPIINKSNFSKFPILLPPLPIQNRIVAKIDAAFSRLDTAIQLQKHNIARTEKMKKSVLEEVFRKGEWEVKKLDEVVTINSGIALPEIFKEGYKSGDIEFFKVAQMNNDSKIMKDAEILFDEQTSKQYRIKIFPKGSTVFPKRGGAILTEKKRFLIKDASYDSNVMGLKANTKILTDEYLFAFIQSVEFSKLADSSTIPQINNKQIQGIRIPIPPLSIQQTIVQHLDRTFAQLDTLQTEQTTRLHHLENLKSSILTEAFQGKL